LLRGLAVLLALSARAWPASASLSVVSHAEIISLSFEENP